jgi:glycosyltransferase involved in cell wall biosynthesis
MLPAFHNGFLMDKTSRRSERKPIQQIRQELQNADVVVFHRPEDPSYFQLINLLRRDGKKIVVDNDDTFKLTDFHPLAEFTPDGKHTDSLKKRQDNIDLGISTADLVTASTDFLAAEYRVLNDNVIVLPNCVDPDHWPEPKRGNGKVRIGIVGSAAIEYDYLHVKDIIRHLSWRDDVEMVMFGLGDKEHREKNPIVTKVFKDEYAFWDEINPIHFPWCKNYEYQEKLNEAMLDIMIIPRKDNYFNRCKSNVKFLEAAMLEIPIVAQSFPDGPYEEVTPDMGVLIKDDKEWLPALNELIEDVEKRREMGRKAKEYVLEHYDIKKHAHKWAEAYEKLCER